MTNGREKGAVGERELADLLGSHGMMARRTVQYCGNTGEASDLRVEGLHLHVECKRVERIRLAEWVDQATNDAKGRHWAIFTRQSRRPWLVIQTLEDWVRDSKAAAAAIEHRQSIITRAAEEAWNVE